MAFGDVGKVHEQEPRRSNRVVSYTTAGHNREGCPLDGVEHLGSEDHVVVAGDEAFQSSAREIKDELVILIGAKQATVDINQVDNMDVEDVLVDGLAQNRSREVLIEGKGRGA
jgi:hypothetical protein